MNTDKRDAVVIILIGAAAALLVALIAGVLSSVHCHRQWDGSGMRAKYGLIQGCMLEVRTGAWIPAESYREMP